MYIPYDLAVLFLSIDTTEEYNYVSLNICERIFIIIREGNGNPLQYSSLEKSPGQEETGGLQFMGLQKSQTQFSNLTKIIIILIFKNHNWRRNKCPPGQ